LRDTGREEIALAALESIGFQTRDLLEAMRKDLLDLDIQKIKLRVDGGMTQSIETMQILADLSGVEINIPETQESTAKGVAWLAGMKQGVYSKKEDYSKDWKVMKTFLPKISSQEKEIKYSGWVDAVNKTRKSN
jgi:glycerol kinase